MNRFITPFIHYRFPSLRRCSFSTVRKHDPYSEIAEDHKHFDSTDLFARLGSKHIFDKKGSLLSFSAVEESYQQIQDTSPLSTYEYEEFMKMTLLSILGIPYGSYGSTGSSGPSGNHYPFVSTSGCIANYRTVLDVLILNGLSRSLFIPRPSDNRLKECIFRSKVTYDEYRFLNYTSSTFNFGGMLEDFYLKPHHSCLFVDIGVQYPTGCYIHPNHWNDLLDCCKQREHLLWLNLSNGGLASGVFMDDLIPVQQCIEKGIPCILSVDFTNSLGLYAGGMGCILAFADKVEQAILMNGLNASTRDLAMYKQLFSNTELITKWNEECAVARQRFHDIRKVLYPISFLQNQIGPFSTLPLSRSLIRQRNELYHYSFREDGLLNLTGIQENEFKTVSDMIMSLMKR